MRTRTPIKRGEMEAVNVILCLGGFPNVCVVEKNIHETVSLGGIFTKKNLKT